MLVAELEGFQLDYWVAMAEGEKPYYAPGDPRILVEGDRWLKSGEYGSAKEVPKYSTSWGRGGPIIERERIKIMPTIPTGQTWYATMSRGATLAEMEVFRGQGDVPLVAAMRAYVASKFGEAVQEGSESNG